MVEGVVDNLTSGVGSGIGSGVVGWYNAFMSTLPAWAQTFVSLLLLVLLVVLYAVFVWKVYRFIATKNLLKLNLNKYNRSEHPVFTKIIAAGLYLLEYIIILPFFIFFWFAVFTIFLIFLTESLDIGTLLIVSATIVAAIRMTSYYNEDLSKDLAKLLPFTLLAVSILNPGFFNVTRIFTHFSALPQFLGNIAHYLVFIILLETILRFFDFLFTIIGISKGDGGNVEEVKQQPAQQPVQTGQPA